MGLGGSVATIDGFGVSDVSSRASSSWTTKIGHSVENHCCKGQNKGQNNNKVFLLPMPWTCSSSYPFQGYLFHCFTSRAI